MKTMKTTQWIAKAAIIAALYTILTVVFAPISFSEVQMRISEALCILPVFTTAAVPGLFVGCLLANLLGGALPVDILFGSLATLAGALITRALRKTPYLSPIGPILANAIVVPLVLRYAYGLNLPMWILVLSIAAGEIISAGVLGIILYKIILASPLRQILAEDAA